MRTTLVAAAVLLLVGAAGALSAAPPPGTPTAPGAPPAVFLSDRSARTLGVGPGDLLDLSLHVGGPWKAVRVSRVYRPVLYPSELPLRGVDIRLHLPDLQGLLGGPDQVDSIVLRLRHPDRAPIVAADLNASRWGFRAYTSSDLARRNSSTFEVIAQFHRAIGLVTILASGAFLLTIMTLKGEEMRRQVALLRLVGISRRTVAGTILLVASGAALLGSGIGIGLGYVLSWTINAYYRSAFDTDLLFSRVTPRLVGGAVALSIALGLAAGVATVWRLFRRSPLDQVGR
jgi:putative ABC transport system permease protein